MRGDYQKLYEFTVLILVIVVASSVFSPAANAQVNGTGSGAMLRSGVGARALGMGGAFVAVVDDYSSTYWNPAGLVEKQGFQVGGMRKDQFAMALNLNYLSGIYSLASPKIQSLSHLVVSTAGVGLGYLGFSTQIHAASPGGTPVGEITYSERVFMGSLGMAMDPLNTLVGVTIKNYRYRAPRAGVEGQTATAFGLGFDAGIIYHPIENVSIGGVCFDFGNTAIQWHNTPTEPTDTVPSRYALGVAYQAPIPWDLTISSQYNFGPNIGNELKAGAEFNYLIGSIRGGIVKPLNGKIHFTAGTGLDIRDFIQVDVAWIQNRALQGPNTSSTLVFSTEVSF